MTQRNREVTKEEHDGERELEVADWEESIGLCGSSHRR
jgi:hypothetical protein